MARRASWKGHLKFDGLSCGIALYSALNTTDGISFHIINRKTGNRVQRQFIDSETEEPVDRDEQVKGYRLSDGDYVMVGPEELAALMPDSDKVFHIKGFLPSADIDHLYLDRVYHLSPADAVDEETLVMFARSLERNKVAALAHAVLFRKNRILLIRADDGVLTATTLHFDYEVRSEKAAFKGIPDIKFDAEMLELAGHIIEMRAGKFDPADYSDRYEDALAELVKAKMEGREIKRRAPEKTDNVIDLKEALRLSAKQKSAKRKAKSFPRKKKAG